VNMVMNLSFPQNAGNVLTSWRAVSLGLCSMELVCWLVVWLVGQLVGWLVGCLAS